MCFQYSMAVIWASECFLIAMFLAKNQMNKRWSMTDGASSGPCYMRRNWQGICRQPYLTPEETRTAGDSKSPGMCDNRGCAADLQQICSVLGVEGCYEEAVMQLQNHFSTTDSTSVKKNETILSRAQWNVCTMNCLLDTLQVKRYRN